jgi:16S rRNA (uracil1498-N3)-methyltransferase
VFWTFVDPAQMSNGEVTIGGPQGHHLARVLRVHLGERGVAVASGREYQLEVIEVAAGRVRSRILADRPVHGEPTTAVTLLQAVLPNPDFDAVLEGGTAVGIQRFVALQAERSVARPPADRLTRWRAIVASAAEQSHRGVVPEVIGPLPLRAALAEVAGSRLLLLDPGADLPLSRTPDGSRAYTIAVGPEGGWTEAELATFHDHGAIAVSLGPRILRARLAPIVAAAILVQQP